MLGFFNGEDTVKLDPKGRVTIPLKYREVIQAGDEDWSEGKRPEVVVVYGQDHWNRLQIYPKTQYKAMIRRIETMPGNHPARASLLSEYGTHSILLSIDEEGRLSIPQRHRERLKFGPELYLSTKLDHIRLWRYDVYWESEGRKLAEQAAQRGPDFDLDAFMADLEAGAGR